MTSSEPPSAGPGSYAGEARAGCSSSGGASWEFPKIFTFKLLLLDGLIGLGKQISTLFIKIAVITSSCAKSRKQQNFYFLHAYYLYKGKRMKIWERKKIIFLHHKSLFRSHLQDVYVVDPIVAEKILSFQATYLGAK